MEADDKLLTQWLMDLSFYDSNCEIVQPVTANGPVPKWAKMKQEHIMPITDLLSQSRKFDSNSLGRMDTS
jgi:hypothetical protein